MALVVDWLAHDPGILGTRLADRLRLPRPDPDVERLVLVLEGGAIRIARAGTVTPERLVDATLVRGRSPSARDSEGSGGARLLGVAWATVDADRAIAVLAARFGLGKTAFAPSADERWLGAASWFARRDESAIVVLEPTTEGRVAAALARFGEGPVAVYLELPGPAEGAVRAGPLGAGALLPGAPAWGPFAIVVAAAADAAGSPGDEAAGTIDR